MRKGTQKERKREKTNREIGLLSTSNEVNLREEKKKEIGERPADGLQGFFSFRHLQKIASNSMF